MPACDPDGVCPPQTDVILGGLPDACWGQCWGLGIPGTWTRLESCGGFSAPASIISEWGNVRGSVGPSSAPHGGRRKGTAEAMVAQDHGRADLMQPPS